MKAYRLDTGEVHLLRLATGDDLYDAIAAYAADHGIAAAWITYLGAVRSASLRYYDQENRDYLDFHIHEHLEVLSGTGNLSLLDGAPFLHTHAVFGDSAGRAFGGHVNAGTEVFALEVEIRVLEGDPPRRLPDDCTGLTLWGGTLDGPCR